MFTIYWPGLILQGHIIFSFIRPDPLLHVYSTPAWHGFARLYHFPHNQAWPTSACLQYIGLTWLCKTTLFSHSSGLAHFCMFIIHQPGLVLQGYIIFPPPGLTHFCMFTIHQSDLVVQGYIIFSLIRPDPLLHVYNTSAWPGFARLYYFPPTRPDPLLHVYNTSAWPGCARLHYFLTHQAWLTSACL